MASGRSEWQRQQAAQQREAARRAKEQERQRKENERARQQRHIESQIRTTEEKTQAVDERLNKLDRILASALSDPPFTMERLRVRPVLPVFTPGPLEVQDPAPDWDRYVPARPGAVAAVFGGSARYERQLQAATEAFNDAVADHRQREAARVKALAKALQAHDDAVQTIQAKTLAAQADLDRRQADLHAGEIAAVDWFVTHALTASSYPTGFPRQFQVAYRPENRDVVIEFELPNRDIVPAVRAYKYVKTRDSIDPVPRPQLESKQRYAQLLARIALRTLHEVFTSTPAEVVEAVVFNGRLTTTDLATGKEVRPHLLSVEAERTDFLDLVLSKVDPAFCLKRLNALVSPNPYDVEAIEPFITFDLSRFRFDADLDVVAGLDSRKNLLELSPTEFEHLARQLFIAMGADAWTTIPSKDGGVDAVATSKDLFFGGTCLVQAKRYSKLVGLEAVHALTGVMADHNATRGVLVTTSWFGRASEQFAQRNRITLIGGAELKHLIKEHLNLDVIPGVVPPRRGRSSPPT